MGNNAGASVASPPAANASVIEPCCSFCSLPGHLRDNCAVLIGRQRVAQAQPLDIPICDQHLFLHVAKDPAVHSNTSFTDFITKTALFPICSTCVIKKAEGAYFRAMRNLDTCWCHNKILQSACAYCEIHNIIDKKSRAKDARTNVIDVPNVGARTELECECGELVEQPENVRVCVGCESLVTRPFTNFAQELLEFEFARDEIVSRKAIEYPTALRPADQEKKCAVEQLSATVVQEADKWDVFLQYPTEEQETGHPAALAPSPNHVSKLSKGVMPTQKMTVRRIREMTTEKKGGGIKKPAAKRQTAYPTPSWFGYEKDKSGDEKVASPMGAPRNRPHEDLSSPVAPPGLDLVDPPLFGAQASEYDELSMPFHNLSPDGEADIDGFINWEQD